MDRQTGLAIDAVTGLDHVVLDVATYSVLWAKQRSQSNVSMLVQQVRSVAIPVIDRRLIADQSDTRASQGRIVFK